MELQINANVYWENTIRSAETTLGLLSAFQEKGYCLIDDAIQPLKELLECGRDFEKIKLYQAPSHIIPSETVETQKSHTFNKRTPLEPNWEKVNSNTICVLLPNEKSITAIAVTTEAQLEAIIPEIRDSEFITIDCEFLGLKKEQPLLKLLQIAVSKEKGYAIQVDLVGREGITRHLKPLLEDESFNQIGWAYRGDAMAIECYMKNINMAPVLDLQAKLKSIAVEELSLNSAIVKYASDWEGYDDFIKIKQFRDTFSFSAHDCIWTKDPLPARALVYSIFDVVCLFALAEATCEFPSSQDHFWPLTITQGSNQKALDRWHRQRAMGINSSQQKTTISSTESHQTTNTSSPSTTRTRTSNKKNFAPANDIYDDQNPQFQQDLNEAIKRSKTEYLVSTSKLNEVSNANWQENEEQDTDLCESMSEWRKELIENQPEIHFSKPLKTSTSINVKSGSWGTLDESSQHDNSSDTSWLKSWPLEEKRTPVTRNTRTRNDRSSSHTSQSSQSTHSPKNAQPSPANNNIRPPVANKSYFRTKPEKEKYSAELKSRVVDNPVKLSGDGCKPEEMAEASWNNFAMESVNLWGKGIDSDLKDMESKSPVVSPAPPPKDPDNNTFKDKPDCNWDTVEEQPRTMEMQMNQVPIRYKFSGPKVSNPLDDGYDDDDDDDNDQDIKSYSKTPKIEDLPTFVDDIYLSGHPYSLTVHSVVQFDQLNMIQIPITPYVAAITYHMTGSDNKDVNIKAIQIYIATEDAGVSYSIALDKACLLRDKEKIPSTRFGYLLTSPDVKRVTWYWSYIKDVVKKKLGFSLSTSVDVSRMVGVDLGKELSFHQAASFYLKKWDDWESYNEKKLEQDKLINKSFGYAPWDEKNLRMSILEYSSFCGLVLYMLYKSPKSINHIDEKLFCE